MTSQIEALKETAKKDPKRIILPEGDEPRVLKAASVATALGIAETILIGKEDKVNKIARDQSVSLDKIRVIEPGKYPKSAEITEAFYNLRKHKGITRDEARDIVLGDSVYFGAMLVRLGVADGFVAGASHTTSNVARAAIHCLELDREISVVSGFFVIELENSSYGDNGLFIFGDCAIIPDPDPDKLASITISASRLYERLFSASAEGRSAPGVIGADFLPAVGKGKARIALLSYSTKGSAKGDSVEKVLKTLKIIKEKHPDLMVDGELQLDAAIVPEVAGIKAPKSDVAGKANVLIFPNLDAGNIAYKLTQRLGSARVIGPILQGLTRPCSDLSRGCGVEEIVDAIVVNVIIAQRRSKVCKLC
ncbi:MAG: hypothetical protein A2Z72_08565 [Omnitrophica bacterium RBG_13_46_9]|nr:MAG: hypothetical protein A2Z72_08565 [Omnitrophica bacterium RBG_13_46_9]